MTRTTMNPVLLLSFLLCNEVTCRSLQGTTTLFHFPTPTRGTTCVLGQHDRMKGRRTFSIPSRIHLISELSQGVEDFQGLPMCDQPQSLLALMAETSITPFLSSIINNGLVLGTTNLDNPGIEAEVLNDVSYVVADVLPLVGTQSTAVFRLFVVLGRLLAMIADFLTDKIILPDEFLFQVSMLALSCYLFYQSVAPTIKAVATPVSAPDIIVFDELFKPVGLSKRQFRSLLATSCLDWVTLEPGHVLENEKEHLHYRQGRGENGNENSDDDDDNNVDYLYWLYEGEVDCKYKGISLTQIERTEGKSIDDPTAVGLLSDMRFLYRLDRKEYAKRDKEGVSRIDRFRYPMTTLTIGNRGATVVRINSKKLFELMKHDDHLDASIRSLLLKSLQRKVGLLLNSQVHNPSDEPRAVQQSDCDVIAPDDRVN